MTKTHRKKKSQRTNRGFDKRQWKALNDTSIYVLRGMGPIRSGNRRKS